MGYSSYSTMGGFGGEGEYGGLGPEPKKDKNLTEAVSYIYEDVKDIFSEDIKETKKNQGIMSPTFFDNDDKDDSPPTILENVTDVAKAFMGFFGKANPLLGVAAGITASISGSSVAEQLEKVRKIDTPFDYNKVYNQYLETPKTGLVTIPSRAKTAAAFKGSLSDESMFVPTTLGSFTPPPSTPTGYGAGTDETMFVPTPTGEPYPLNRPIPKPLGMGAKIKAQEDERTRIIDKLAMSESSNNFAADNKLGYIGRLQFGAGRLKDFTDATGRSTANFKNTPSLQKRVEQWHIKDLESFIIKNKLDDYYGKVIGGVVVDKDAIIAMAHLGGKTGAKKFLDTKGSYNKRDKLGTYMSDYGKKFSAAIEPLYNDMQKIVDPVPVKRPTIDTTTQTSEATTDNEDNLPDEGDPFDLRSVPIDTLLDPSIYLFDTNDREEKIEILKQMGIIQLAGYEEDQVKELDNLYELTDGVMGKEDEDKFSRELIKKQKARAEAFEKYEKELNESAINGNPKIVPYFGMKTEFDNNQKRPEGWQERLFFNDDPIGRIGRERNPSTEGQLEDYFYGMGTDSANQNFNDLINDPQIFLLGTNNPKLKRDIINNNESFKKVLKEFKGDQPFSDTFKGLDISV